MSKDDLLAAEGRVFGDTRAGSEVIVRVAGSPKSDMREMLPHRSGNRASGQAYCEGETIDLTLATRPGHSKLSEDAIKACALWLTLGGVGKRARRGFGSFSLNAPPKADLDLYGAPLTAGVPKDGEALATRTRNILTWALGTPSGNTSPVSPFPAFALGQSKVLVCKEGVGADYKSAMVKFWNEQLRNSGKGLKDKSAYGYALSNPSRRRASPLHLHLAKSTEGFHLVLTAFNSMPLPSHNSWDMVRKLLNSCANDYDGEFVWG